MKNTSRNISTQPSIKHASKDALRILFAVVCIVFASFASIDRDSAAEQEKAQAHSPELAQDHAQGHQGRARPHDLKRLNQPASLPLLQRINGAL